jgi:hypothetical protein
LRAEKESNINYLLIIGIQNRRDGFGTLLIGNRALILARVELLEVEFSARGFATPQAEIIAGRSLVTGNCGCQYVMLALREWSNVVLGTSNATA